MRTFIIPALIATVLVGFTGVASAQQQGQSGGQTQPAMDMNAFMARCALVRQQPGTAQTAQGRQLLDQCDQMDRSMGMTPPPRR